MAMIEVSRAGAVAEVVLNRPEALNAISTAFAGELAARMGELAADGSLRAAVLRANGEKAFCVGADLKERNGFSDAEFLAQRIAFRELFGSILGLPVPIIAAVGGYALGGGLELALCCDLIAADETAVFGLPEVTVGLVPGGGGTQLLARKIGPSRAGDLLYTGRRVGFAEACALGIVDRPVDEVGTAPAAALELARRIAANSPVAVRNAKRALRTGVDLPLAAGLDVEDSAWRAAAFSADRAEGIRAFNEKRPPVFGAQPS
ncbi:enoyl-CoA hydratase/isomerase family protein [Actinospica sp. MGRD01-02]|uniref:enoyl-CoA hydratase n=1 Tax=Actinospica acidithermotolerans TaxID=2828514 RepID=A0A941IGL6_9ACTN|nr:enoyl-CoA hydratase-related protein [Actinospica acidithermotolerans]MBR7824787.1 enoyl-CoA hydratase/isomerase family protein [Actinospica acidithermotolerans]